MEKSLPKINSKRIDKIFECFRNKKIIVLGDLMIDEYLWGKVARLSPEAPVPIVEIENDSLRFGGAANVALNLKTLGCEPILIGLIGNDRMGEMFYQILKKKGMTSKGIIQTDERPTTVKTRIIGDNQHIARVDRESREYVDGNLLDQIISKIDALIGEADAVILQDYNKGMLPIEVIKHTLNKAKKENIITTVDPKFTNFMEYKHATVFKPNIKELSQALARVIESDKDANEAGFEILAKLSAESVLLTRGAKGISLFEKSGESSQIQTKTRKVADVSGAGDTVISTMTAALTGGASYKEAACLANYAAGIVCEEVGIVPIERETLLREVQDREIADE